MAWQEVEGTKPPLEFDENEDKVVDEKVLKTEEQVLNQEIRGASLTRIEGESLGSRFGDPPENEVFNSKTGYVKK